MLSAIIATRESERSLVPTLSALFPGVMTGLLTEVLIADAASRDATREAGCRFLTSAAPLGDRLKSAADTSKGSWLLFLPAGSVPDSGWVDAVQDFVRSGMTGRVAAFSARHGRFLLRPILGRLPKPEQGLLISRQTYQALGGHGSGADADTALLRQVGRRRIALLPASVTIRRDT